MTASILFSLLDSLEGPVLDNKRMHLYFLQRQTVLRLRLQQLLKESALCYLKKYYMKCLIRSTLLIRSRGSWLTYCGYSMWALMIRV